MHPTSSLSRYFILCYLLLIVLVSFYPFIGWRTTGIPVLDFYTYAWPYYHSAVDEGLNVLAYIPLGFAIALNIKRRWLSLIIAFGGGLVFSAGVEFTQQFLPTRIASNVDILCNAIGALIGAISCRLILGLPLQHCLSLRHRWLYPHQWIDIGVLWLGLWFFTQLDPTEPLFSLITRRPTLPQPYSSPLFHPTIFLMWLESSSVFFHVLSVALLASCLGRTQPGSIYLIWITFALGFIGKISMAIILLPLGQFFSWLNVNVLLGGFTAIWVLTELLRLSPRTQALIGCLALLLSWMVNWRWPFTPSLSTLFSLLHAKSSSHLLHLTALASSIRSVWTYGSFMILLGIVSARANS